MKIEKALSGRDLTKKLKVGAENGSAFFYCGTIGDFITNLEDYSLLCKKNAIDSAEKAQNRLDTRIKNYPTVERFIRAELKSESPDFTMKNFLKYVEWYLKSIGRMMTTLDNAKRKLGNFKPLSDREVVEIREADQTVDPAVTIVIVNGYEYGTYWTTDEANNDCHISFSNVSDDDQDANEDFNADEMPV